MKFSILTLIVAFISYACSAAVSVPDNLENDVIEAIEPRDVEPVEHDDGRQEFKVYQDGNYEGSVIIAAGGEVQAVDADGNEIAEAELDVDADLGPSVEKRIPLVPALRVVWLLAKKGIQKGSKLYKVIKPFADCVGHQLFIECAQDWAWCIDGSGLSPTCIQASLCLGKEGMRCIKG